MTYVDTNILIRLMTNDVLELSEKAAALVKNYGTGEIMVADGILVELFFVLENHSKYKFSRTISTEVFEGIILPTPQFRVTIEARSALEIYKQNPKLDFMDCLLAVYSEGKSENLLSFDKDLLKILK